MKLPLRFELLVIALFCYDGVNKLHINLNYKRFHDNKSKLVQPFRCFAGHTAQEMGNLRNEFNSKMKFPGRNIVSAAIVYFVKENECQVNNALNNSYNVS